MKFEPSRLRRGEMIAGGGAVVLRVVLFVLAAGTGLRARRHDGAGGGQTTTLDGWDSAADAALADPGHDRRGAGPGLLSGDAAGAGAPGDMSLIVTVLGQR